MGASSVLSVTTDVRRDEITTRPGDGARPQRPAVEPEAPVAATAPVAHAVRIPAQRTRPEVPAAPSPAADRGFVRVLRRRARPAVLRAVDVLDPVARPVVTTIQRRQGVYDPAALLAGHREGRYLMPGRWGRVEWHEPEQRAVIPVDENRRVPKNVARAIRNGRFTFTFDNAFDDVVHLCATVRGRGGPSTRWLTPEMEALYRQLHRDGHAHCIEVWLDGRLVGGEFGVAQGGLYCGESMFFLEPNAGKVAMAHLSEHLRNRGYQVFDSQTMSAVAEQFGAFTVSRAEYRRRVREALSADVTFV